MRNAIQWDVKHLVFQKIVRWLRASPPNPHGSGSGDSAPSILSVIRLSYLSSLTHVSRFRHFHFLPLATHTTAAFGLPFYGTFVSQTVPFSKFSDDVIACNWCFAPPPPNQKSWLHLSYSGQILLNYRVVWFASIQENYNFTISHLPHSPFMQPV